MIVDLVVALLAGAGIATAIWATRPWIDRRIESSSSDLADRLGAGAVPPATLRRWVVIWHLAMFGVVVASIAVLPNPLVGAIVVAPLALAPRIAIAERRRRRLAGVDRQLPAAMASVSNGVAAGLAVVDAFRDTAGQTPEPTKGVLLSIVGRFEGGQDLGAALEAMRRDLPTPSFTVFASALSANRQFGGDLAGTLVGIAESLRQLAELREKLKSATSAGRTNIKVLLLAPVAMLSLLWLTDPEGVELLLFSGEGQSVLAVAIVIMGVAVWWGWTMVNAEV